MLGKTWRDITHPEDLAAELERYGSLVRGELPNYSREKRCVGKDGSLVWIDLAASLQRDPAGRPAYVIAIVQDISERKRLQEQLQEAKESAEASHDRMTGILESITDAFFSLDLEWRFTYINAQAEVLLRRSRDELLGRILWEEFPEVIGSTFERTHHEALATGRAVTCEEFYPPFECWFESRTYLLADGLSVYFRDVTERRRAEDALRLANDRLHSPCRARTSASGKSNHRTARSRIDAKCISISSNNWATTLPGIRPIPRSWRTSCIPTTRSVSIAPCGPSMPRNPGITPSSSGCGTRTVSYRRLLSRGTAICDERGRLVRGTGTSIDITDLKRAAGGTARERTVVP